MKQLIHHKLKLEAQTVKTLTSAALARVVGGVETLAAGPVTSWTGCHRP